MANITNNNNFTFANANSNNTNSTLTYVTTPNVKMYEITEHHNQASNISITPTTLAHDANCAPLRRSARLLTRPQLPIITTVANDSPLAGSHIFQSDQMIFLDANGLQQHVYHQQQEQQLQLQQQNHEHQTNTNGFLTNCDNHHQIDMCTNFIQQN